jgi:hypothetical protein
MATDPAKLLKKYQDDGYNILTPSITLEGLSENHRAAIETVSLSPETDEGDVYKDPNADKRFIVSKQGLDKLSVLAGVLWPDREGSRRIDDGKNRDYIAFEAFGAIRKADGQLVPVKAFYDMDLIAIEDDLNFRFKEKAKKLNKPKLDKKGQAEYVEYCVGRDMRSIRKHRATRCESGARNRVIRALLGLKKKYTAVELKKPFVCVRITYQPDYNDPEIKKLVTMMSLGAQSNLFGLPQPQLASPIKPTESYEADAETFPAAEDTEVETEKDDIVTEGEVTGEEDEPDEFALWDRKSQLIHIAKTAKTKGYDLDSLIERMEKIKSIEDLSEVQLIKIHDKLKDMEDNDIPF